MYVCINLQVNFSFTYDLGWQWGSDSGEVLWEDGMGGFLSEVVGYECAIGPKPWGHAALSNSKLVFSLDEYLNALALSVLIQFCCSVAASTGSCTPCELELFQVPTCARQYSHQEWLNTPQPHGTGSLCPLKVHCVTPDCACLSSPYILAVENGTCHIYAFPFFSPSTQNLLFSQIFLDIFKINIPAEQLLSK